MIEVENKCIKTFPFSESKKIRITQIDNAIRSANIRCLYSGNDGSLKNCDLNENKQSKVLGTGKPGGTLQMICQLSCDQAERISDSEFIYHIGENSPDSDLQVLAAKIRIKFSNFSAEVAKPLPSSSTDKLFFYPVNRGSKLVNINDMVNQESIDDSQTVQIEVLKDEKGKFIFEDYVNINLLDFKGNSLAVMHMNNRGSFTNFNITVDTSKGLSILPLATFDEPKKDQPPTTHKFRVGPEVDAEVEITEE